MFICQYCSKESKSTKAHVGHERCCPTNPNRNYKNGMTGKTAWNKGKTKATDDAVRLRGEKLSARYTAGELAASGVASSVWSDSPEARAARSKGGGYKENAGHSKKFKVFDSYGRETTLQSSYELECSQVLNELGFKWLRPKALKYDGRNYFADFYLPDYDIWLDPKNDYKAKMDQEKINKVIEQNEVKLHILLKHQITKEYIGRLAEMD